MIIGLTPIPGLPIRVISDTTNSGDPDLPPIAEQTCPPPLKEACPPKQYVPAKEDGSARSSRDGGCSLNHSKALFAHHPTFRLIPKKSNKND